MKRKKPKKRCRKVGYPSITAARRALEEFGRARGARRYYPCPHHGSERVYHLTRRAQR